MGKFIKDLTDVTITYDSETMRVESITIKINDIGCLVDRNGYLVAMEGKTAEFLHPERATKKDLVHAKKAIAYNKR